MDNVFHCFLELLPELRLVIAALLDVSTLVRLARTCRLLRDETSKIVPRLPAEWRHMWREGYTNSQLTAEAIRTIQYALLEVVKLGIPRWPNAFSTCAHNVYYYRKKDGALTIYIIWSWYDGRTEHEIMCDDLRHWYHGIREPGILMPRNRILNPASIMPELKAFVSRDRRFP